MLAAIQIGSLSISTFYISLVLGAMGMCLCCCKRRSLYNLSLWQCGVFTALLTAVGVLGAMLLYAVEAGKFGGVSFYGSVYLIPILMPIAGLLFRLKPGQTMDICGPCVAIMIGCLRISCFLNGCCGGWQVCIGAFCFSWPTQIIDSIADFMILTWLISLEESGNEEGKLYPLFMVSYSIMRFFLEFLRNTPKNMHGMSNGQWYALVAVLTGLLWLKIVIRNKKRHEYCIGCN